ncbi:hypothetical protein FD61_10745 [Streptococcus macedonicus]|nr:hypothetical protein FD61_10745 [Streptococcus macedonicus]
MLNRAVKGKVNSENKNPNLKIAKQLYNFGHTKHTKISSEEISDGRKYSLLFLCDKVEVSC